MNRNHIVPEPLKKGDTVGIVAPAGQIYDTDKFESGVRILSEMGFETRFPRSLWPGGGYLADRDDRRADEFQRMMADPEVKGLIAARGGFGCLRMLEFAQFKQLRNHPKIFIGFSDITILLNRLSSESGILTFHGPVVTSLAGLTRESLERFYQSVTGSWRRSIKPAGLEVLRVSGFSEGILLGGNLSTLTTLLGTKYDVNYDQSILFLEDVNEPLYKIDRMLTQMKLAGKFDKIRGLILGEFSFDSPADPTEARRYQEYIWGRALELTAHVDIPVWANFPVGHSRNNLTLPVGATASMNSTNATLYFC